MRLGFIRFNLYQRRRTLRKVSERQISCMHRYGFTKHSRITKYGLPQSPAFLVNILKDLSIFF